MTAEQSILDGNFDKDKADVLKEYEAFEKNMRCKFKFVKQQSILQVQINANKRRRQYLRQKRQNEPQTEEEKHLQSEVKQRPKRI